MLTPQDGETLLTTDCKLVFLPRSLLFLVVVAAAEIEALLDSFEDLADVFEVRLDAVVVLTHGSGGIVIVIVGVVAGTVGGRGVHRGDGNGRHSDVEREGMR